MNRASLKTINLLGWVIFVMLFFSQEGLSNELISVDKALAKIFPQASFKKKNIFLSSEQIRHIENKANLTFAGAHTSEITIFLAQEKEQTIGYVFEDTVMGKWGPIHYLVGIDHNGVILQAIILDYQEIRGKPVAKSRFLKQYKGKTQKNPLQLQSDIDAITGATISSRSLTDGIRKNLHIF